MQPLQHQHEEQTEPPGGEGNVTEQEDVSEEESNETPPPDVTAEDSVNIKLKFLDETELDVTTKLSECLKKFRKRHLDTHLSLSPTDKVSKEEKPQLFSVPGWAVANGGQQ